MEASKPLPFVVDFAAGQAIVARVGYVETPELSGVAYLTVFRQDVYPFTAGDFWYTFQGLSTDGTWYVSADFVITASMFPTKLNIKDANRISSSAKRWAEYLRTSLATLDGADPSAFTAPTDVHRCTRAVHHLRWRAVDRAHAAPVGCPVGRRFGGPIARA